MRSLYNWAQNPSFRIMYVIIRFFSTIIPITLDFLAIYEIIPFRTHKNLLSSNDQPTDEVDLKVVQCRLILARFVKE